MPVYEGAHINGEYIDAHHMEKYDDRPPHERIDSWIISRLEYIMDIHETEPNQAMRLLDIFIHGAPKNAN